MIYSWQKMKLVQEAAGIGSERCAGALVDCRWATQGRCRHPCSLVLHRLNARRRLPRTADT